MRSFVYLFFFLISFVSFAEVESFEDVQEQEEFPLSSYLLSDQILNSKICPILMKSKDCEENEKHVRKLPQFKNPFSGWSLEKIRTQVEVLKSHRPLGLISAQLAPMPANTGLEESGWIEIYLPQNRCETGWIKWGDAESGFYKCPVLGRGDSVLGPLELLAGLQAEVSGFKGWILSENAGGFTIHNTKGNSRFKGVTELDYCLIRPETQQNGATIVTRSDSTIGKYKLVTGKDHHNGKKEWGRVPGAKDYLLPIKMEKIPDERNKRYSKEGRLLTRDDFWIHSHQDYRDEWPLEATSSWGCPRLSRSCQAEVQKWIASEQDSGREVFLKVIEQDTRAYNFIHE